MNHRAPSQHTNIDYEMWSLFFKKLYNRSKLEDNKLQIIKCIEVGKREKRVVSRVGIHSITARIWSSPKLIIESSRCTLHAPHSESLETARNFKKSKHEKLKYFGIHFLLLLLLCRFLFFPRDLPFLLAMPRSFVVDAVCMLLMPLLLGLSTRHRSVSEWNPLNTIIRR